MMRTSTRRVSDEPSGRISPSCSTRSSRTCMPGCVSPDLVEEDRAAVRDLEQALLVGVRAGEGAALVAEELALEQRVGQRGAVLRDEALALARPA